MWGKLQFGHGFALFRGAFLTLLVIALGSLAESQSAEIEKTFHDGTEAMRKGDLQSAAEDFARVTAAMPRFAEAHFNLGLVQLQQGHLNDAIGSFHQSLSLKPSFRWRESFSRNCGI